MIKEKSSNFSFLCLKGGDDISKIMDELKRFKGLSMMQKVVVILPYAIVMCLCVRVCELYRLCIPKLKCIHKPDGLIRSIG